jgi:hypothetical protein
VALIGGALWVLWASLPWIWAGAINYRRWVVPLALPFYLFALLDALRVAGRGYAAATASEAMERGRLLAWLGGVFALVITIQSGTWAFFVHELQTEARATERPVVTKAELKSMHWWQLDHWGTTTTFMFLQGQRPTQYLAYDEESRLQLDGPDPKIPLWRFHPISAAPGPVGWFDHRPLLEWRRTHPAGK